MLRPEPIKILHLISTLEIGGVQKQVIEVAKRINKKNFVNVIGAFSYGSLLKELKNEKIQYKIFRRTFRYDFFLPFRIAIYLRREKINILHTYLFTANTWGRIGGILSWRTLIVASERNAIPWKSVFHYIIDFLLSFPTKKIIACSEAVKKLNLEKGFIRKNKIDVIYNGVDLERFKPYNKEKARKFLNLPVKSFIIGSIGRLHWCKGYNYLIDVINLIKNKHPEVLLLLVGDGEERENLKEKVKRLGLKNKVIFTGEVENTVPFIQSWDIGVFPSIYEGFGIGILETMACGIPVIASSTGGIPELVGNSGKLVKTGSINELRKSIEELIDSPELREKLGKEERERAKNFSISKTVEKWEELYVNL